jgi:CRP-like cAMP-binding protein
VATGFGQGMLGRNRLLATLASGEQNHLAPYLTLEYLPAGSSLCDAARPLRQVYFPVDCVISVIYASKEGATACVALVGREGFLGIPALCGALTMSGAAQVQFAGYAYGLDPAVMRLEFQAGGGLGACALRHTQVLIAQISLNALCYRCHTLEQQLSRLLLSFLDRLAGFHIPITHEAIANMLGVRREGVSHAARSLMRGGAIRYQRGNIVVLERSELELRACECYGIERRELERLLPERSAVTRR